MPNDNQDGHTARRRIARTRKGMAFSNGGVDDSSSGGGVAASDDDDLNDLVESAARDQPARIQPRPDAIVPPQMLAPTSVVDDIRPADQSMAGTPTDEYNPAARLTQVGRRSSEYEREYRLGLLHRMLMRNLPLDEIATQLGVSVRQVFNDRKELAERLKAKAKTLDIDHVIGDATGFYEEVQAMALRAASNAQMPMPMRLAAMRTALASQNDKHRFYQAAGVYDVLRFRKGAGDGATTDIQRLMEFTDRMLQTNQIPERAPTQNPLGEFSGGDSEVLDL